MLQVRDPRLSNPLLPCGWGAVTPSQQCHRWGQAPDCAPVIDEILHMTKADPAAGSVPSPTEPRSGNSCSTSRPALGPSTAAGLPLLPVRPRQNSVRFRARPLSLLHGLRKIFSSPPTFILCRETSLAILLSFPTKLWKRVLSVAPDMMSLSPVGTQASLSTCLMPTLPFLSCLFCEHSSPFFSSNCRVCWAYSFSFFFNLQWFMSCQVSYFKLLKSNTRASNYKIRKVIAIYL